MHLLKMITNFIIRNKKFPFYKSNETFLLILTETNRFYKVVDRCKELPERDVTNGGYDEVKGSHWEGWK